MRIGHVYRVRREDVDAYDVSSSGGNRSPLGTHRDIWAPETLGMPYRRHEDSQGPSIWDGTTKLHRAVQAKLIALGPRSPPSAGGVAGVRGGVGLRLGGRGETPFCSGLSGSTPSWLTSDGRPIRRAYPALGSLVDGRSRFGHVGQRPSRRSTHRSYQRLLCSSKLHEASHPTDRMSTARMGATRSATQCGGLRRFISCRCRGGNGARKLDTESVFCSRLGPTARPVYCTDSTGNHCQSSSFGAAGAQAADAYTLSGLVTAHGGSVMGLTGTTVTVTEASTSAEVGATATEMDGAYSLSVPGGT